MGKGELRCDYRQFRYRYTTDNPEKKHRYSQGRTLSSHSR